MSIVGIEKALLKSEPFRSLKASSMIVLLDFLMKRQFSGSTRRVPCIFTNNGKLEYTYAEAENRGLTRPRFQRAIDELIEKGFLDIKKHGGAWEGDKTLYSLSDRWQNYGTPEFEKRERQKDLRNGAGWDKYHLNKGTSKRKPARKIIPRIFVPEHQQKSGIVRRQRRRLVRREKP